MSACTVVFVSSIIAYDYVPISLFVHILFCQQVPLCPHFAVLYVRMSNSHIIFMCPITSVRLTTIPLPLCPHVSIRPQIAFSFSAHYIMSAHIVSLVAFQLVFISIYNKIVSTIEKIIAQRSAVPFQRSEAWALNLDPLGYNEFEHFT